MGSIDFSTYQGGTHLGQAFRDAMTSGDAEGIADKNSVVTLHAQPVPLAQAHALAADFQDRNVQGVGDKRGPAGAIAVSGGQRNINVDLVEKDGGFATLDEAAAYALAEKGLLRAGESIQYGVQGEYTRDRRGRVASGQALVPVSGATGPEQTGWLFFGSAPY